MIKKARMLEAVHTHTHTHTHGYQFNRKVESLKLSFINNVKNKMRDR